MSWRIGICRLTFCGDDYLGPVHGGLVAFEQAFSPCALLRKQSHLEPQQLTADFYEMCRAVGRVTSKFRIRPAKTRKATVPCA